MRITLFLVLIIFITSTVFASGELLIEKGTALTTDINWYESEFSMNNNVVVGQWKITNTTNREVILDEIKLIGSGTGDESKINVTIYEDYILYGSDGKKTYHDVLLGSGTFTQDNGSATITLNENESYISVGGVKNYLVVYSSAIGANNESNTFRHYIGELKGRITSNYTEVTGAYEGIAQYSPKTSFIELKPFFVSLSSKNGLMYWVSNGEQSPAVDFNMMINGNYVNDSFSLMRLHNCFPNINSSGYFLSNGGQYNIKNSSLVQKFMSSEENFTGFNVMLRSIQKTGTDEITLTLRKNSIDGEIIGQKTLDAYASLTNQQYYFEITPCENVVCGDGILDETEECQGTTFNGKTCSMINPEFYSGELICNNCVISTETCYNLYQTIQNSCIANNKQNTTLNCTSLNSEFNKNYVSGTLNFDDACAFDLSVCLEEIDENEPIVEPIIEPDQNEPIVEEPIVDPIIQDPVLGPVCGNGIIEIGEFCEINDLKGVTCETLGFDGGVIGCNINCNFDTSNCFNLNEEGQIISTGSTDNNTPNTNTEITDSSDEETNIFGIILGILAIAIIVGVGVYFFEKKKNPIKSKKK